MYALLTLPRRDVIRNNCIAEIIYGAHSVSAIANVGGTKGELRSGGGEAELAFREVGEGDVAQNFADGVFDGFPDFLLGTGVG